jgi:hypothetical protein
MMAVTTVTPFPKFNLTGSSFCREEPAQLKACVLVFRRVVLPGPGVGVGESDALVQSPRPAPIAQNKPAPGRHSRHGRHFSKQAPSAL